eukprot:jgi/Mesen1/2416/ME000157S01550
MRLLPMGPSGKHLLLLFQVALCSLLCLATAADARVVLRRGCLKKLANPLIASDLNGIMQRLRYPNTTAVTIVLTKDIQLTDALFLTSRWSCTIIKAEPFGSRTIFSSNDSFDGAANVLVLGVNIILDVRDDSPNCTLPEIHQSSTLKYNCPSIHIYRSNAIQIAQATVFGRIDTFRSNNSLLDTLDVRANPQVQPGLVRYALCGDGRAMEASKNVISNCKLTGSGDNRYGIGVYLSRQSVGVTVQHNFLYNFTFAGIQCGQGQHNVMDCALNRFIQNYIDNDGNNIHDATGIYFDTHWYNPGNYLRCNYVEGGGHCLYLDYASSGVYVDGMVCYNNLDGIKINTGKNNKVGSLLVVGATARAGWISCQDHSVNNCNRELGDSWYGLFEKSYKTPAMLKAFPYMDPICNVTQIGRTPCNPTWNETYATAEETGGCSGLPYLNRLEIAIIANKSRSVPKYLSCDDTPIVENFNKIFYVSVPTLDADFRDYDHQDFSLKSRKSAIFQYFPKFRSCERKFVGPQHVNPRNYIINFNAFLPPTWGR